MASCLYGLAAGLLTFFVALPFVFLLPLPRNDLYGFSSLALVLAIAGIASWQVIRRPRPQRRALIACLLAAALLCMVTPLATRVLASFGPLDWLTLDILAPLFGLDGERAYDAADYELWCEVWFVLALPVFVGLWLFRRRRSMQ
jgi:hypothetical protein